MNYNEEIIKRALKFIDPEKEEKQEKSLTPEVVVDPVKYPKSTEPSTSAQIDQINGMLSDLKLNIKKLIELNTAVSNLKKIKKDVEENQSKLKDMVFSIGEVTVKYFSSLMIDNKDKETIEKMLTDITKKLEGMERYKTLTFEEKLKQIKSDISVLDDYNKKIEQTSKFLDQYLVGLTNKIDALSLKISEQLKTGELYYTRLVDEKSTKIENFLVALKITKIPKGLESEYWTEFNDILENHKKAKNITDETYSEIKKTLQDAINTVNDRNKDIKVLVTTLTALIGRVEKEKQYLPKYTGVDLSRVADQITEIGKKIDADFSGNINELIKHPVKIKKEVSELMSKVKVSQDPVSSLSEINKLIEDVSGIIKTLSKESSLSGVKIFKIAEVDLVTSLELLTNALDEVLSYCGKLDKRYDELIEVLENICSSIISIEEKEGEEIEAPVEFEMEPVLAADKKDNLEKKSKMTDEAKDYISKKIKKLLSEGYEQDQAIAIAYDMARKEGYKVPEKRDE